MEVTKVFDETTLRSEIVSKWGEYGAHTQVYDWLLQELKDLKEKLDRLAAQRARRSASRDATVAILTKHPEGLRLCDVARELQGEGFLHKSKNPAAAVLMLFQRNPRFFEKRDALWFLKSKPN